MAGKGCRPWLCQRKRQPAGGAHGVELFRELFRNFSANFFLPEVFGHESDFIYSKNAAPPRSGFYLHKLSGTGPVENGSVYTEKMPRGRNEDVSSTMWGAMLRKMSALINDNFVNSKTRTGAR